MNVTPSEIEGEFVVDLRNEPNKSLVKFEFRNPLAKRTRFFAFSSDNRYLKVATQSENGILLESKKLGQFILSFPSPDSRAEEIVTYLFIKNEQETFL